MRCIGAVCMFVCTVHAFIEVCVPKAPIVVIKELKAMTVTLSDVKLYTRTSSTEPWTELKHAREDESSTMEFTDADEGVRVEMTVYESPTKEWTALTKIGVDAHVSKMAQYGSKVNFVWTSTDVGYYMFLFRVVSDHNKRGIEIGMDVVTYEGRPEDTSIYSHTDSQIRNKEKRLEECVKVSREILGLQDLDKMEEGVYAKVTRTIFKVVLMTVMMKVVCFAGSFIVINNKIQKFYTTKKIVA